MPVEALAYLLGVAVLAALWIVYRVLMGTWSLGRIVEGADGRASTSKFQWFLWTIIVVFGYVAIWGIRALNGNLADIDTIPRNVLIAMGLSGVTMATAKGITAGFVDSGRVVKPLLNESAPSSGTATPAGTSPPNPLPTPKAAGAGALVQDDDGEPDLSKIQLLAWTAIAGGAYLVSIVHTVHSGSVGALPDIDASLMVLMGLGQGAYLGKKLTTTDVPRLTGLSPSSGSPPLDVTVSGLSLGDALSGGVITQNGNPMSVVVTSWQDAQLKIRLPDKQSNGSAWQPGQRLDIGAIVSGQASVNTLPFTVTTA